MLQIGFVAIGNAGHIRTRIDEPFMRGTGRYDVFVRHRESAAQRCGYTFFVNGVPRGEAWYPGPGGGAWTNQMISGLELRARDEIKVNVEGSSSRLDYVQFNLLK